METKFKSYSFGRSNKSTDGDASIVYEMKPPIDWNALKIGMD